MTVNYMNGQKNDMLLQRYGFSSPVVIFSQAQLPRYIWVNDAIYFKSGVEEDCVPLKKKYLLLQ